MPSLTLSPVARVVCCCLQNLPTREETYAALANRIKGVPTKVAKGIKAVPTKVARSIALVAELDEDKTKLVADVVGMGPGKTE